MIILDHLTDTQRRAYIIADNKLAINAGWNLELLAQEVRALEQDDFDIDLIGFSEAEMAELLATGEAPEPEDEVQEAIPEAPANPVTQPGDVWVIGSHRLVCGDCRDRNGRRHIIPGRRARQRGASRRRPMPRSVSMTPRAGSGRSRRTSMPTGIGTWRRTSRRSLRTMAPTS